MTPQMERLAAHLAPWLAGRTDAPLDDAVRAANQQGDATPTLISAILRKRGFRKVGYAHQGYDRTPLYRRTA